MTARERKVPVFIITRVRNSCYVYVGLFDEECMLVINRIIHHVVVVWEGRSVVSLFLVVVFGVSA